MDKIFYLSYSNVEEGLIFPNELENGVYSPGMWVLQSKNLSQAKEKYLFDAINKNEVVPLILNKVNKDYFQVDTLKYGKIYFRLKKIYKRHQFYNGKSTLINNDLSFFQLIPISIPKLTQLCLENNFYLIGSIDEDIA